MKNSGIGGLKHSKGDEKVGGDRNSRIIRVNWSVRPSWRLEIG